MLPLNTRRNSIVLVLFIEENKTIIKKGKFRGYKRSCWVDNCESPFV
jgi:hypothetical protein